MFAEKLKNVKFKSLSKDMNNLASNEWWLDKLERLKKTGDLDKLINYCYQYLPLPHAFDQASKAIRKKIRFLRKNKIEYQSELSELYELCVYHNALFWHEKVRAKYHFAEYLHHEKKLYNRLEYNYMLIGYEKIDLLCMTDCKWLVGIFGKPVQHIDLKTEYKNIFEEEYEPFNNISIELHPDTYIDALKKIPGIDQDIIDTVIHFDQKQIGSERHFEIKTEQDAIIDNLVPLTQEQIQEDEEYLRKRQEQNKKKLAKRDQLFDKISGKNTSEQIKAFKNLSKNDKQEFLEFKSKKKIKFGKAEKVLGVIILIIFGYIIYALSKY